MTKNPAKHAAELFDAAKAKSDAGDEQAALSLYLESLALDREQPSALYNVGLIYKYRREWKESLRYNRLAAELRPDDEATNWNIGIAATALREWRIAREAWRRAGIEVEDGDAPIVGKFGYTPVRLNGFASPAAHRVCFQRCRDRQCHARAMERFGERPESRIRGVRDCSRRRYFRSASRFPSCRRRRGDGQTKYITATRRFCRQVDLLVKNCA